MPITGLLHTRGPAVHADLRCKTILSESGAMESKTLNMCVKRLDRSMSRACGACVWRKTYSGPSAQKRPECERIFQARNENGSANTPGERERVLSVGGCNTSSRQSGTCCLSFVFGRPSFLPGRSPQQHAVLAAHGTIKL